MTTDMNYPTDQAEQQTAGYVAPMAEERIDQFRDDINDLELKTPGDDNERNLMYGGIGLMGFAIVVILAGYWGASGSAIVGEQMPYLLSGGMLGVALMIAGAALFVRYSLSRYLRFWLVRDIYEQRTQTDRVVESMNNVEVLLRAATRPRSK
jgi:hypothetical protein